MPASDYLMRRLGRPDLLPLGGDTIATDFGSAASMGGNMDGDLSVGKLGVSIIIIFAAAIAISYIATRSRQF